MTNFERIKAMSVEEMAEFIDTVNNMCGCDYGMFCQDGRAWHPKEDCIKGRVLFWLQQEADAND